MSETIEPVCSHANDHGSKCAQCWMNWQTRFRAACVGMNCDHGISKRQHCPKCLGDFHLRGWLSKDPEVDTKPSHDPVSNPKHYTSHPSGVECIQITEHMGFNLGNAIKYLWRADDKGAPIEDLKKAIWYIQREIGRREKAVEGGAK